MVPLWTVTRRLVFVLHSFPLVLSSHFVVFWRLSVSIKCIIVRELRLMNPILDSGTCVCIRGTERLVGVRISPRAVINQTKVAHVLHELTAVPWLRD